MQGNMYVIYFAFVMIIPCSMVAFMLLPGRRAMLATVLLGWLFLPNASVDLPGLPDIDKLMLMAIAPVFGILAFDSRVLSRFKFSWWDLPVIIFCTSPFITSVLEGYGPWDGLSAIFLNVIWVGLMYFYGRIYMTDLPAFRDFAMAILIGGVVYLPFCLFELRMSPCLHRIVYGYHSNPFINSARYGNYRPVVFLANHLAVAVWIGSATVIAFWFWRTKLIKQLFGIPISILFAVMMLFMIVCGSYGALILTVTGIMSYFVVRYYKTAFPLLFIGISVTTYIGARTFDVIPIDTVEALALKVFRPERVESLYTRLSNEQQLTAKALQRPLFGWGRWGRSRIYDYEKDRDATLTDSVWVIMLGWGGLVSLTALVLLMVGPAMLFVRRYPAAHWLHPWVLPAVMIALITLLYAADNLLNGKMSPAVNIAWGGLSGLGPMLLVSRQKYTQLTQQRAMTAG